MYLFQKINMQIKKILYLEENSLIAKSYILNLKNNGLAVDWLSNGAQGLTAARNNNYDLIVLDAILPEKNAYEIISALRQKEDLIPNTKIIILTNYELTQKNKEDLVSLSDGYFIKSDTSPKKLLELINKKY